MTMVSRKEAILKAVVTIDSLKRRTGVTAKELSVILNMPHSLKNHDYRCAQRWIDAVSLIYPVVEIGSRSSMTGPPSIVYKIIK